MPVISSNALVRVLDSYSCVGMVSDSTLTSMPANGFAALTNHSISFSWSAFDSVEGWNSSLTHFSAAAMSATAGVIPDASIRTANDTVLRIAMIASS